MTHLPMGYLIALGEARSCLASLADSVDDVDLSAHFDHLLIELDGITGDVGPACCMIAAPPAELLGHLESAAGRLVAYGVDRLCLELLLFDAFDALVS